MRISPECVCDFAGICNENELIEFNNNYEEIVDKEISNNVLGKLFKDLNSKNNNIPLNLLDKLKKLSGLYFLKDRLLENSSGFVIAGFGSEEDFPSIINVNYSGVYKNKFKNKIEKKSIDTINDGAIISFAQGDVIGTFLQGIDPRVKKIIKYYIESYFKGLLSIIFKNDFNSPECQKLINVIPSITQDFENKLENRLEKFITNPILRSVRSLSKEDLAVMAESLIELTCYKRKVTIDSLESVGGPIDVAVISKNDGFIWIKRKHYFDKELNMSFMHNYFMDC